MTGSGAPLHLKDHLTSGEQRGACFSSIPEPVPSSAHALSSLCGRHSPGIDTSFSLHFPKEILILCVQQCCYRGGVVAEVDAVWAYSCFCSGWVPISDMLKMKRKRFVFESMKRKNWFHLESEKKWIRDGFTSFQCKKKPFPWLGDH